MPARFIRSLHGALLAAMLASALVATGAALAADLPTRAQVQAAADKVRADPDLGGMKTEKTLRFKERDAPDQPAPDDSFKLDWLRNLIASLTEGARMLMWALGALAVALLIVGARRFVKMRAGGGRLARDLLPSHVGALDIRPESLPDDIGGAAAALWQRGQHRPALSLLYRGALSRLVHVHEVPIRAASTEGDCVALASQRLGAPAHAYFTQLVDAWQLAAYGGRLPTTGAVLALCAGFNEHLPAAIAPMPAHNVVAA